MTEVSDNWVKASSLESWGIAGHIGVAIHVMGIDLTQLDEETTSNLNQITDAIHKTLISHQIRNSPEEKVRGDHETNALIACFPSVDCVITVEKIRNEYTSPEYAIHRPWLMVTTPRGRIKIGSRKRVIEIDWTDSDIVSPSQSLFANEGVTKDVSMIHAWGYEKAAEYLSVLLKAQ